MAMVANYGNLCGMALNQIIETVNQMIAVVEDRIRGASNLAGNRRRSR